MVERDVFRVAGAGPVTARAQDAGDTGESGNMLGIVPGVERGIDLRCWRHPDQQEAAGMNWRGRIAGEDLLAFIAQQTLYLRGHPLRPRREILAADHAVARALQDS